MIDTSNWKCRYIVVPVEDLRVEKVEHEVVEWEASFCSEDAIPVEEFLMGNRKVWREMK